MQINKSKILAILKWIFLLLIYPFIFLLITIITVFTVGNMNGYFIGYQYIISNSDSTKIDCYSNSSPRELHKIYCRENQNQLTRKFIDFYENR
jgi:hypothetical protein